MKRIAIRLLSLILTSLMIVSIVPIGTFTQKASAVSMSGDEYWGKAQSFINDSRWRDGVWFGASQGPKLSSWSSYGCCAYAADFVKYVFGMTGQSSGTPFYSPSDIRTGDILYVSPEHWIVVLRRNGNELYTAEGSWANGNVRITTAGYSVSGNAFSGSGKTFVKGYHYLDSSISGSGGNDTQAPTYSNPFVSCISGSSFNINATLSDNVGIKDAWVVLYGPDGEHQFTIDANIGFFYHTFFTSEFGGSGKYTVHVYIRDYADNSTKIVYENINAVADSSAPQVTNTFVSCVSSTSFNVNASVSDNDGIKDAWVVVYSPNGEHQFSIAANSGFFYHTFYTADLGGPGTYTVHIYFYDYSGNSAKVVYNNIVAKDDSESPSVTNQNVSDISSKSFKLNATIYDSSGIRDGWIVIYSPNGEHQFSIAASNGNFSYEIDTTKYGGPGIYTIHVYFYDIHGNGTKIVFNQIEAKDKPIHGSASCVESINTIYPTCCVDGKIIKSCSCGHYEEETIAKLGHIYFVTVTPPTCIEQGYTTHTCSRCDDSYVDTYTDPLNHSSSTWVTSVNPTTTSDGLAEKVCNHCGKVLDQFVIPCLAPTYVTGITLSSESETVSVGDSFTLTATIKPDTAENKNIVWSSRNTKIATVENGIVRAVKPGTTAIVAESEDGGFVKFCLVRVISLNAINGAVIDNENNIVYGLAAHINNVDNYFELVDDSMHIELNPKNVGTGTIVNIVSDDEVIDSYNAVIFGDVNGDGWYDGQDAITVSCLANGMLTREQVGEAVWMAADCNHDGVIDQLDVDLLNQAGVLLSSVDQTKPTEELLETSAEYNEYLSLIDQMGSEDAPETPTQDENDSFFTRIIALIESIVKLINTIFTKIF